MVHPTRRRLLLSCLIFSLGLLTGLILGASPTWAAFNASQSLLDLALVIVALTGPFLAVDYASRLVVQDHRSKLVCAQKYQAIDTLDRILRKLVITTRGKTAVNLTDRDIGTLYDLDRELDDLLNSPWLSDPALAELLDWHEHFRVQLSELSPGGRLDATKFQQASKLIEQLEHNRRRYLQAFLQEN